MKPADIGILRAALLDGEVARAGYAVWREQLDFDSIPYGHQRLLPLLDRNLTHLGIADPLMNRFRGIRRFFWVRNLRLLDLAKRAFAALQEEPIPFIVLKGAGLVAQDSALQSLRPMDDVDILVERERLADVARVLSRFDLMPDRYDAADLISSEILDRRGSWGFKKPSHEIDVHWHALHLDLRPQADYEFWKARRTAVLDGLPVSVLDPADHLLNICAHAYQAHAGAAAQYWPADAVLTMRRHPDLSYRRLVESAGQRGLSVVVGESLAFLASELDQPIPDFALTELGFAPSRIERKEMRLRGEALTSPLSSRDRAVIDFQDYRRSDRYGFDAPPLRALRGYVRRAAGTARLPQALLAHLQAALGDPAVLRRALGRDRHRQIAGRRRLPRLGQSPDLVDLRGNESAFVAGWSGGEPGGRWTEGVEAVTAWLIEGERRDLVLAVEGFALINDRAPTMTVEVWANDTPIAEWRFIHGGPTPLPARLRISPREIGRNSDLMIVTFLVRSPRSPTSIGLPRDPRMLGLHVTAMTLSLAD